MVSLLVCDRVTACLVLGGGGRRVAFSCLRAQMGKAQRVNARTHARTRTIDPSPAQKTLSCCCWRAGGREGGRVDWLGRLAVWSHPPAHSPPVSVSVSVSVSENSKSQSGSQSVSHSLTVTHSLSLTHCHSLSPRVQNPKSDDSLP